MSATVDDLLATVSVVVVVTGGFTVEEAMIRLAVEVVLAKVE